MLDNETKRRIDTARDVLVGKLPDPKSQVEQITIALIYKFMDDMDRESVHMGGKASFFIGDYDKFAWSKIFDPRLGGFDMLALYSEAITRMSQNPNIPQLFRDIFKNAYLPYRDPETLKLFLKTINDFSYDHSEQLGDAFEYLLSVLGSQGDAGQFRTPRHIIDFMVDVIKPQKNETILDPACGTAGFLISSFKHIIKDNTKKIPGDLLTLEERRKLLANFKGYDISPDMVRLSLVNLYLHGFVQPKIVEYDTLTSEDRWNEYADVVLANPPFMSPKGGIKPHKKFSVQSNRSEVLFVDYIAEHLKPTGRAAVIVPEGIIFQSGKAYKQLRKMLIENHLYAVVSLPAGVFNPYSGVKTSILFMDKSIAKKTNNILFVKIENDGYGLGAQRREQTGSDLPDAVEVIADYVKAVRSGANYLPGDKGLMSVIPGLTRNPEALQGVGCVSESSSFYGNEEQQSKCSALLVGKEKLAESGDYNLTGDRYRITERKGHQKWPMVRLGEVCEIIPGQSPEGEYYNETGEGTPFYQGKIGFGDKYIGSPVKWTTHETKIAEKDDILMSVRAPVGPVNIATQRICIGRGLAAIRPTSKVLTIYVFTFLRNKEKEIKGNGGAVFDSINRKDIEALQIPLPPLEVQREIVAEIEGYQKLIDGARQVVESWKPQIEIDPEWPMVKLGDDNFFNVESGGTPDSKNEAYWNGEIYWATLVDLPANDHISIITDTERKITKQGLDNSSAKVVPVDSVIVSTRATIGRVGINKVPLSTNQGFKNVVIRDKDFILPVFLAHMIKRLSPEMERLASGGTFKEISKTTFCNLQIPLPPPEVQHEIVAKIEAERKVIDGCKELIALYEAKIKKVIDKVWEE